MTITHSDFPATRRLILIGAGAIALTGLGIMSVGMAPALAAANDTYPEDAFKQKGAADAIKSLYGRTAEPSDKVKLVGINQGEGPELVKRFLEARGLKLGVALDTDQGVGRKYGVDAIPRTIVVGPDGKVAWEQPGYDPDGESGATDVIRKLLDPVAVDPPAKATP